MFVQSDGTGLELVTPPLDGTILPGTLSIPALQGCLGVRVDAEDTSMLPCQDFCHSCH
jgi:branched-subunit amino acid aminotransferase/4-amino-4-deoxychorismate lyase